MKIKRASTINVVENFGKSVALDCYFTRNQPKTKKDMTGFIEDLIDDIGMKLHGDVHCEWYRGRDQKTEGFSAFAFLTTSNISCHTVPATQRIYLDIFTCGDVHMHRILKFLKDRFDTEFISYTLLER